MTKTKAFPAVVVLALLVLAGIGAWAYQLIGGLAVTGMNNGTSWGLYITCFMFFVGLSAGGLIVASSAAVFGIKDYKAVARPAILLSTVCIVAAAAFVLVDLGGIQRVFNLIIHPNLTSPLMWDVIVITLYLVINIVYLALMARPSPNERALAVTSRFALPVAILVHSVTAWIFGLQIAKLGWYSAIMAPLFVASALDSGLALLLIVLVALNVTGVFKTEKRLLASLAGLLAACIAIDGFMVGCEVLTMAYPGADATVLAVMTSGATAPLFWGEIVLGLVVPFCLLVFRRIRENMAAVTLASALVVVGVLFKRAWLLLSSFGALNIEGAPGVTYGRSALSGTDMWELVGAYAPTWVEGVVALGIIALAALLFVLLAQRVLAADRASVTEGAEASATAEAAGMARGTGASSTAGASSKAAVAE
ncbi:MAG: polysulfide reductase NrfD [Coriobacteriales bacterium]|jgi:molybdopterin-containing oxidoreductase family membrane subunit|nr:polysulfide reductase NrfD [Coriobacteriales bacterium]